ncbi:MULTISPECIES: hypothetical protein [Pandoraea]|uniref:hypothetical protein n=1 Tax=Pandoraea TaxID=93217 RepID=UPI001F5C8C1A|nr:MULTISPECIES: hypothetical protein [Pandoraea]MCI3206570.1 hypothetical protein [Pandoraea sp. LA3]MDN4584598.1 hypothetical protein [Pandoraea capi]
MTPGEALTNAISPALSLLSTKMDTPQARVMLLSIGLQESHLTFRRQQPTGPARGLWQCEQGTQATRGGIWGLYLFKGTSGYLSNLCAARKVAHDPVAIYKAIETDDVLAAGCARLLLFTDPKSLPAIDDVEGSWALYLRVWNPGKPRPAEWGINHKKAVGAL